MEAIVGCSIRRETDLHRVRDAFEECLARLNRNAQIGFERNSDVLLRITLWLSTKSSIQARRTKHAAKSRTEGAYQMHGRSAPHQRPPQYSRPNPGVPAPCHVHPRCNLLEGCGSFKLHSVSTVGDTWRMLVLWSKIRIRGHHKSVCGERLQMGYY